MNPFKVGDMVESKATHRVYTITSISPCHEYIRLDNNEYGSVYWGFTLVPKPTKCCKTCGQELPELTELEKKLAFVDKAIGKLEIGRGSSFTCVLINNQSNSLYEDDYKPFIKPFLFGGIGSNTMHPSLENNGFRICLLKQFKVHLKEKYSEDTK